MSTDPEDSLLEEALRQDFPSADAQTRVRRRLIAAGVAVGNGMAVGSAAAAAGASGAGASVGVASKALAMSWGIKLGVMAAVAVPTVGLLVEHQLTAPASSASAAVARQVPERSPAARPAPPRDGAPSVPALAPSPNTGEPVPLNQRAPLNAPAALLAPAPAAAPAAGAAQPSRGSFEPAEPASPSKATSTLAEETRLLDAAFAELALGHTERAAALISEHERRFAQGLLLKERQRAKLRLSEISGRESEGGRE